MELNCTLSLSLIKLTKFCVCNCRYIAYAQKTASIVVQERLPRHCIKTVADHIENTVLILLHTCMLRTLPSNGRYLQIHCLATGLYATLFMVSSQFMQCPITSETDPIVSNCNIATLYSGWPD
jgi:hypothetical protein